MNKFANLRIARSKKPEYVLVYTFRSVSSDLPCPMAVLGKPDPSLSMCRKEKVYNSADHHQRADLE